MKSRRAIFLALVATFLADAAIRAADDPFAWPAITSQTRPWAWWWWHGSAVDETNITHELQRFHDAGLGGVQVTTIYGLKVKDPREIQYLTPPWLAMMGYTVDEAQKFGMGVDMSLGSGWCFGGPTVSGQDANASVVVKTFDVPAGGKLPGKFNRNSTQALVAFAPDGTSVELTDEISADGGVDWTAPAGSTNSWTVYAISQKPSGQKVKRPAPGGEGWMLNPAYPQAVTNWLTWFDAALANYTGPKPQAVFQDSYEYRTDWAPDFFAQFERLRGYKLQAELPALFGDAQDDHTARVKYDYRRTLSDLMAEQSEPAWIDWAHRNGFSTIYQAHGTPGNWLDLYADADMPETEMFHNDRSILISKFASSASHTQGHQLTGAETGTWLKEHFTETLADVKYLADDMFLAGVNRIFYHGTCYSPDDAPWPGWLFYASTEMNPRNPIWHDVPALNEYIARCQSILQSGQPDNDVLLYWPVADFWSDPAGRVQPMSVSITNWFDDQSIGKTAHELWNQGYAFDYVSDAQLQGAKVVDGKIQMPGGKYQVIAIPNCKYIPLDTLKSLFALAQSGGRIVFMGRLPTNVSGYGLVNEREAELTNILSGIETNLNIFGKGMMVHANIDQGQIVQTWLLEACTPVRPEPFVADSGLSYVRRSFDGGWNYFIANRTATNFDGWISLARPVKSAVILDPMTGNTGVAAQNADGRIHLQLAAGQSEILRVFDHVLPQLDSLPVWNYFQTNGTPAEITGNWNVSFVEGGPTLPAPFQTPKLGSWTDNGDTNAQTFAGTVKYETTFDSPVTGDTSCCLDLGDVRQSARVKVNGKDYGTLILPPFRVVVDNLKPTGNTLEVEVTSVAANRIRDLDRRGVNWKIFGDINIVDVNYKLFDASNWPVTDCGLLGPVTLTPVTGGK